jgi:hypothetical protein
MALFRRKKREGKGQEGTSVAPPSKPTGGFESAPRQPTPLESGLERKWEEAFRRARERRPS